MLKRARQVIEIEAQAVKGLLKNLDGTFVEAVDLIAKCAGRVVVCGMGKTGIIGRKIAATLSSTGTPSVYLHSAEAVHGDLGQVMPKDIVLIISQSGQTEETLRLLPAIKKIGARTIAMTGNMKSSLAKYSDIVLNTCVAKEGCPLGLAPMASTTATLALGDALAACLIDRRGFKQEDFALNHPGGTLGRRLLLKVDDIMRSGEALAKVGPNTKVKDVLLKITRARSGCACVVDGKGHLLGIFTDGDLRRHVNEGAAVLDAPVKNVMTLKPLAVKRDKLAAEAFDILKTKRVDELPVIDQAKKLVGLIDVQDLLKAGLV